MFEESDLVGKRIEEFIAADELERVLSSFKSLRLDSSLTLEATIVSKNNHFIDVAISANLLSIAGQLVIQAFFLDITQRKLAEAALYEEKERAQITLSSIADGVVVTDQYGVITSINPKAETLTGWSAEDARGQAAPTVLKIADEETQLPISGIIDKCLHKGQPVELAAIIRQI